MGATGKEKPKLYESGRRVDGRGLADLRGMKIESRVLNDADGSA